MPMPAENIIATHDDVRNSGASPSPPSGMLPYLLAASQMTKTTKPEATSEKSQPVLCTTKSRPAEALVLRLSVPRAPHRTKAMATPAATPKTTLSTRDGGAWSWFTGGGSSAGCRASSGLLVSSLIRHDGTRRRCRRLLTLRVTAVSFRRPLCRTTVDKRKTRRDDATVPDGIRNGQRATNRAVCGPSTVGESARGADQLGL